YDACAPGVFACTPNAGNGPANVLRITQHELLGGDTGFAGYETTSAFHDELWMAATIGAECRAGYRLEAAGIRPGWELYAQNANNPQQVYSWQMGVSVPDAKVMPEKLIAVNIPMSQLFEADLGSSMVLDFDSIADVYAHGESVIAQRVAMGTPEAVARSQGFVVETHVATHAAVTCRGLVQEDRRFVKTMPYYLPLTIEFLPRPLTPGVDQAAGGGELATAAEVTHVGLTVLADPVDACVLHLSGTVVANGATDVTYRMVDPYGRRSGSFQVSVLENVPAFVHHEIPIPTSAPSSSNTGIDVEAGGPDTGKISGTFRLEVTSPNTILSNHAGFSVDPCPGVVNPDLERPTDDLVGPSDPTHGDPTPPSGDLATEPTTTVPAVPNPTPEPTRPTTVPTTPTTTPVAGTGPGGLSG
ncbi:MAG TPA: hypothetical protein VK866_18575, partial [Acidimicrobiales bacterium]|nr:hypothetical protein [Acidimicrobiales bacterium]